MPKVRKNPVRNNNDVFHPGRENVHPLFDPTRFNTSIGWNGAFYDAVVLATRLIESPQALQNDYCFYFGRNRFASRPFNLDPEATSTPLQYSCDKAIGEFPPGDIGAVGTQRRLLSGRIRFEVASLHEAYAETEPQPAKRGINGCDSVISSTQSSTKPLSTRTARQERTPAFIWFSPSPSFTKSLMPQTYTFLAPKVARASTKGRS